MRAYVRVASNVWARGWCTQCQKNRALSRNSFLAGGAPVLVSAVACGLQGKRSKVKGYAALGGLLSCKSIYRILFIDFGQRSKVKGQRSKVMRHWEAH